MICRSCGSEIPEQTKFCIECGASQDLRCPSCSAPHGPGQKFCGECGERLPTEPAAVPDVPELRLVSVLFVDIVSYTTLSESRDAEDVREFLGRYFDSARTIISRYGGAIEKFIGDAVMAVWGVPVAREDDAERAVRAALELVEAVACSARAVGAAGVGRTRRRGDRTGRRLEESGRRVSWSAIVSTLHRACSRRPTPGACSWTSVTRQVTRRRSRTRTRASTPSREARADAAVARNSVWWRGSEGAARATGFEPPLVGRDADLRLFKELFHGDARAPCRASGNAVSGAAGVGKTRLRWEFEKYIDGLAETVLVAFRAVSLLRRGVAYWALSEIVRGRLGIAEEASAEDASAKLHGA